ncbi:hypothetical protein [Prosthecobacter sp.]|uniref:hypothetical protein n=1 Tax=Prosthecobacter sp. TaxID=1965333 RepID=UPI002ABBF98F|nr:hypothetical protein [Prosthecobacter sp.]MDZ4402868.1 hypothetical protein [Prosthecobacter sp.]
MTLEHAIHEALNQAVLPLKASDITKLVKPLVGRAATPKAVVAALESLVATGALNRIAAGTSGKPQPLFTPRSSESATAALLKQYVHLAKKEQPAAKLRTKLPEALLPHFEGALAQLVAAGDAFVLPGAKRLVFARKPKPSELLDAAKRRALQKMLDAANSVRSQAATLADFITWLDGDCHAGLDSPPIKAVILPDEAILRSWYDLDRLRSSTMMIPIPQTFARYEAWAAELGGAADSQVLRSLIETLYNNGHLLLEPCERPQDLPEQESALLVPMSLGPPGYSWCWLS